MMREHGSVGKLSARIPYGILNSAFSHCYDWYC